jgi:hypothetical protein
MQSEKTLKKHADLVDRMATRLGVDLEEAILRGQVPMDAVADAVLRCTGCSNPGHCNQWLEASDAKAEAAPGYCRNNDLWAGLLPDLH